MRRHGVGGLLVTRPASVRYLSGFTGTAGWLLLLPDRAWLVTDRRYEAQAEAEVPPDIEVVIGRPGVRAGLEELLAAGTAGGDGPLQIAFEAGHVTVALRDALGSLEGAARVDWRPTTGLVAGFRRAKDRDEVAAIETALRTAEAALAEVVPRLQAGCTEIELAAELEHACRRRGAEGMAFPTIVAAGPRTALPHGVASGRRLEPEEPLMIDMGCRVGGYCSDLTRCFWMGETPDPGWLGTHELVRKAQAAALEAVAAGVAGRDVDAAARGVIEAAGRGEEFRHGTGHGLGLEIHEAPSLSPASDDVLEEGDVVTVEPALYVKGRWGVRIEDVVVVTREGHRRLTAAAIGPGRAGA